MPSHRRPGPADRRAEPDPSAEAGAPVRAWLHPSRKVGACYAALAGVVLVLVVAAVVTYQGDGRIVMAVVTAVGGLAMTAFLAVLASALLVPGLHLSTAGVTGRLASGRWVEASWDEVRVDVPENAPAGRLRLDVAAGSLEVDVRSWAGFAEFVLLVASAPGPAGRLTPAARREVARLIGL